MKKKVKALLFLGLISVLLSCFSLTAYAITEELVATEYEHIFNFQMATDNNGKTHIVYQLGRYRLMHAYYQGTWIVEEIYSAGSNQNLSFSNIVLDKENNLHLVVRDYSLVYLHQTDTGWLSDYSLGDYSLDNQGQATTGYFDFKTNPMILALDSNGNPHVAFVSGPRDSYYGTTTGQLNYGYKSGDTWNMQILVAVGVSDPSIIIGSDDIPHIVYLKSGLQHTYKSNNIWHTQNIIPSGGIGGRYRVALGTGNKLQVAYVRIDDPTTINIAKLTAGGWTHNQVFSSSSREFLYCFELDSNDNAYLVIGNNLHYWGDGGWVTSDIYTYTSNAYYMGYMGGYLNLDRGDNIHLSYLHDLYNSGNADDYLYYRTFLPDIELNPTSIEFGNAGVDSFVERDITITNMGEGNLFVSDITCVNPIEKNFIMGQGIITNELEVFTLTSDNASNRKLAPGESGTVTVRFTPEALDTYNGSLVIDSNDRAGGVLTIDLAGTGTEPPEIDIAPIALDFGSVTLGSSLEKQITINNQGTGPLALGDISITGESFILVNDISNTTIEPESSTILTIRFAPDAEQSYSESITIPSNDSDENLVTINLGGDGIPVAGEIYVTPGTGDFGEVNVGSSVDAEFTLNNTGNGSLYISSITVSGTQYNLINDGVSNSALSSGGSASFTVRFSPDSPGTFQGSVSITSDDPDEPDTVVSLTGRGTAIAVKPPSGNQVPMLNFITTIQINATDLDGDPVSLSLGSDAPDFVSLSGTRLIFSSDAPAGTYTFTVNAHDGKGGTTSRKLTVSSFGRNSAPIIKPVATQSVPAGRTVTVDISANDPEGDQVILGLSGDAPGFASLNGSQLVLSPSGEDKGTYTILLLASDGRGGLGVHKVNVVVSPGKN